MKKATALLLILLMILNTSTFVFAAPANAGEQATLDAFIEALWQFEGGSKTVLTDMLDVYFQLDEDNRTGFITAYEGALGTLGGFGTTISGFGLSADIFTKLNEHGSDSNVYLTYIGNDKAAFTAAVYNASETILGFNTIEKLVTGLDKVYASGVVDQYLFASSTPYFNIFGYNTSSKEIEKMIKPNIETLYNLRKSYFTGKGVDVDDVENALAKLKDFYNGLSGSDQREVYNHFEKENMILNRITLGALTSTSVSATGIAQADLYVRIMAGDTQLGEFLVPSRSSDGAYTITIDRQAAGTEVTAQIVSYSYPKTGYSILDDTSVTVTGTGNTDNTGNTGNTETVVEIPTPLAPINIPVDFLALAALAFDDIDGVPWAHEAIIKLHEKGIIRGKAPRIFDPNGFITRAEFAALTARMFALTTTEADVMNFDDVKATDWFYPEVKAVFINNVMTGSGTHFNPNGAITRQEIATIIGRILSNNAIVLKDPNILATYTDASDIETWAVAGSQLSIQEGIITGRTTTTFAPKGNATRAEVAVILYRMVGKVPTILDVVTP